MRSPRQAGRWSSVVVLASATALVAVTACSDATPATPSEPPSITFRPPCGVPDIAVYAVIGDTTSTRFRIRRHGGYGGVVDLTIEGLPAGVTARFDPPSLPWGVESTDLIVTTTSDAASMFTDITVWARGDGVASVSCVLEIGVMPTIPPI